MEIKNGENKYDYDIDMCLDEKTLFRILCICSVNGWESSEGLFFSLL